MATLTIDNLVKTFGDRPILNGLSLQVEKGEVFGLIGPNGAGKTTTLRIVATLLSIDSGSVSILGHRLPQEAAAARKLISYLPEDAGAYRNLRGREYLEFVASLYDEGAARREAVERGMQIAALGDRINDRVSSYSKGMMRRLLVGRALMTEPSLAILDEPNSGLDVVNAREMRRIISDATRNGMSVLLSSHNMLEVELLCQRVALINEGRIVATGTPEELKSRYQASNIEEVFVKVVQC